MSKVFNITLPLPQTDNHIYLQRNNIRFMIKEAREWKENAQLLARRRWKEEPLETQIWLDVNFFLKRERDIQGSIKLICDAFEGIVYKNDKQITEITIHKNWDKKNPRVEVSIESL